jgi:hypothetical protein
MGTEANSVINPIDFIGIDFRLLGRLPASPARRRNSPQFLS